MRRSSFSLTGRTLVGSLSAKLYYQQEEQATGYDNNRKPMKKQARVMLAVGTQPASAEGTAAVASIDLTVSREGRLAQLPDVVPLTTLAKPQTSVDMARISLLETDIRTLTEDIEVLDQQIAVLETEVG